MFMILCISSCRLQLFLALLCHLFIYGLIISFVITSLITASEGGLQIN
jgi:hypothetical protein